MFPPKKYVKNAFKQGVVITLILGVIPLSLALCSDFWAIFFHKSHDLSNFNEMLKSLVPSNTAYVHILIWLSVIYSLPLLLLVITEKNLEKKVIIPTWIKRFILNFEYALSSIFSVMFIVSSIFFMIGFLFSFSNLGITSGIGFVIVGLFVFTFTMYALAAMLELKGSFLKADSIEK